MLQIYLEIIIFGMILGGSFVIGELIIKAAIKAVKEFIEGFKRATKIPMASELHQKMIDDEDRGPRKRTVIIGKNIEPACTPLNQHLGDNFPEKGCSFDKKLK